MSDQCQQQFIRYLRRDLAVSEEAIDFSQISRNQASAKWTGRGTTKDG